MPNLANVFKSEIARISRKEARSECAIIRNTTARLKKDVVELKRKFTALESQFKQLAASQGKAGKVLPAAQDTDVNQKARFTAKGIISLRRKLKLTSVAFAKLLGTSAQTVYLWEHKTEPLKLRGKTLVALLQVRGMGRRDVQKIMNGTDSEPAVEPVKTAAQKKAVRTRTAKKAAKPAKKAKAKAKAKK